ncbi:MAG: hypothetical protein R2824_09250 [Saprospiraceae bacterium]|nr:hypothetical protein [Lewinella sp.]
MFVLLTGLVSGQDMVPASYSQSRVATINATAETTQGKVRLYLGPSMASDAGSTEFVLEEVQNSVRRLERQKVQRKRAKKQIELIRHEVESKYLRHYKGLSGFEALFKRGEYNELTAAALVSLLLKELDIGHQLYLWQQQPQIDLEDGTSLNIEYWGKDRPARLEMEEERSRLVAVLNALQLPPESRLYQNAVFPYRDKTTKRKLMPAELTGMLFYRRSLDFYSEHQLSAALTALEKARTYMNDSRLDVVRYAVLFQQARDIGKDSTLVEPLFELYHLHPSSGIVEELVRRFAQLAEHYLLKKKDTRGFEDLYYIYRREFAGRPTVLQQLKEIYFIEMAQYYAAKVEPSWVISYLDSLNTYRPNDPNIQKILTPLLVRSVCNQKDPEAGLKIIEAYNQDFPFLRKDVLFKDMELCYRAERTRLAFDADKEALGKNYLEAFEQKLAQSGLTPRSELWITTAYDAASDFYFRNADYVNARWFIQRALALIPNDPFLQHQQEVLGNY